MPIDALVTATVETAFNTLLNENRDTQKLLASMKGSVLRLNIKEFNKSLIFVFSQQVDVLAAYEGTPDCELTLSLSALRDLQARANLNELFKQEKLSVEGDMHLAQQFASLLKLCKPDIPEILSRYMGDVAAHTLLTGLKQGFSMLTSSAAHHRTHMARAVTEEWQLTPSPLAIADFCDQVTELDKQAQDLEQRLQRLIEQKGSAEPK